MNIIIFLVGVFAGVMLKTYTTRWMQSFTDAFDEYDDEEPLKP